MCLTVFGIKILSKQDFAKQWQLMIRGEEGLSKSSERPAVRDANADASS
jgi:hypothetical protein